MEEKIDRYRLLESVMDRLSIVHDTDKTISTGKNKLCFTVNGELFELLKSSDKITGSRKTILEGVNNTMKPIILYQDDEDRFTNNDVDRLVMNLDRYFISERLGMPEKLAVCNAYYYTKPLLEALGIDLYYIFGCAREEIHAAEGGIPLLFLAENHARKETCVCVFFIKNTCIEIMRFYVKRKNAMPARLDRNSGGENYELEYEGSTPETLKTSVEMLITEFSALLPASGKIFFYGGG